MLIADFSAPITPNQMLPVSTVKKRLLISFSGGRTSAYMLWWLWNCWEQRNDWEILVVFANTGKEVENTLFFVDECSQEWNIPIVWVEGYPSEEGKGWKVEHKVVTYETASRKGEPFEALIKRIGIPCDNAPFCSDQMKKKAIESYCKSIGFDDFYKAIGIRIDEPTRLKKTWEEEKIFYPLAGINPMKKRDIILWWQEQPFDLDIHPDEGNCDNCWKKDYPRLVRNLLRNPKSFDWWTEMEFKYGNYNPRNLEILPPFNFFRTNKSTLDIKKMAEMSQSQLKEITMFEVLDGCAETCEVW